MAWLKIALVVLMAVFGTMSLPTSKPAACQCTVDKNCGCDHGGKCTCAAKVLPRQAMRRPVSAAAKGGNVSPDGTEEIACDLPRSLRLKNVGGTDGAGLCVWASQQHTAIWQHVHCMESVFQYMQTQRGGGWPERVDAVTALMAKKSGVEIPRYIQVQSKDNLPILKLACKTGRMPGVTYSFSPTGNYNGQTIAHMVSLVHASDKWIAILDNNFPGDIEWMDPDTFRKVHTKNGREMGWATVFLADAPPAPPRN